MGGTNVSANLPFALKPDEEVLEEGLGVNRALWLTTHRLVQSQPKGPLTREQMQVEIPLDRIDELSIGFMRRMKLLVAGAVLIIAGVFGSPVLPPLLAVPMWAAGAAATVLYVVTGKRGLLVRGSRQEIAIRTRGLSADEIRAFVFSLEDARRDLMGLAPEASGEEDSA